MRKLSGPNDELIADIQAGALLYARLGTVWERRRIYLFIYYSFFFPFSRPKKDRARAFLVPDLSLDGKCHKQKALPRLRLLNARLDFYHPSTLTE